MIHEKATNIIQGFPRLREIPLPRAIPLPARLVAVEPRVAVRDVLTLGVLPKPVLRTVPLVVPRVPRVPLVTCVRLDSTSCALRAAASLCC
jgi:hypothetical protein